MRLPFKYAHLGKTFLMTIFYLPLLPIGVIINFLGIIFFYAIEKYNITSFYRMPPKINSSITIGHLHMFKIFIFVYAISIYVFQSDAYNSYTNFSLISLIIFAIVVVIPFNKIFECDLLGVKQVNTYEEEYLDFLTNYDTQNPVTKRKGKIKYLGKLRDKEIISKWEYKEFKRKILTGVFVDLVEIYRERQVKKNIAVQNIIRKSLFAGFTNRKDISKEGLFGDNQEEIEAIKQNALKLFSNKKAIKNFFGKAIIENIKNNNQDIAQEECNERNECNEDQNNKNLEKQNMGHDEINEDDDHHNELNENKKNLLFLNEKDKEN